MRTLLVAAAVVATLAAPARAEPPLSAPPSPPAAGAETAADALVEQAARAYDQNRLDEALGLLARAYELSARPSILYNRAQVLRAKDDCPAALDAYSRFVAATTPDDPNRDRASHRRDEMQACTDRRKAEAATSAPPPTAEPAAAPPPVPPLPVADRLPAGEAPVVAVASPVRQPGEDSSGRSRRAMRVAGWALVGAGIVAAGLAAALAWQAHEDQNQVNHAITEQTPWPGAVADEGQRDATWARWLGAAAAVAGGGGVALLIVARPKPATGGMAGDPPSPGTMALIGWSGTF